MEQRAAEALMIEVIQQERLANRARKRVMLAYRQMAQDMEYVTSIWTREIDEYKKKVVEIAGSICVGVRFAIDWPAGI